MRQWDHIQLTYSIHIYSYGEHPSSLFHTHRESDGRGGVALDDPEPDERDELHAREHVHPVDGHVLQEHVVGLVLARDEQQQQPVEELEEDRRET